MRQEPAASKLAAKDPERSYAGLLKQTATRQESVLKIGRETEVKSRIGEYRSKKFYNLGAKLVDVKVLLDELSKVKGRSDRDIDHLEIARRYAMKVSVHLLSEVILELNSEHLERLRADPDWQKAQADSIRKVMDEFEERKDAEWQKSSDEADETGQPGAA